MRWGNCVITDIQPQEDCFILMGELLEEDKDFKKTRKIPWLPKTSILVRNLCNPNSFLGRGEFN